MGFAREQLSADDAAALIDGERATIEELLAEEPGCFWPELALKKWLAADGS